MKHVLSFFILLSICFFSPKNNQSSASQTRIVSDKIITVDTSNGNKKVKSKLMESVILEWETYKDSLRNEILKRKENTVLKESFLQEMYIRNVVVVSGDSLFVNIRFNLHAPDCGAPDCYSTDISFNFTLGDSLLFPQNIHFQEHEYGCVEAEQYLTGHFQLIENTDKHVIYHSYQEKRTLVLFRSNEDVGTTAYYFTEVEQNRINGGNIYNIVNNYNEEDDNAIYPFKSWDLTTNEYEYFIY